jgi:hypothetical protein
MINKSRDTRCSDWEDAFEVDFRTILHVSTATLKFPDTSFPVQLASADKLIAL